MLLLQCVDWWPLDGPLHTSSASGWATLSWSTQWAFNNTCANTQVIPVLHCVTGACTEILIRFDIPPTPSLECHHTGISHNVHAVCLTVVHLLFQLPITTKLIVNQLLDTVKYWPQVIMYNRGQNIFKALQCKVTYCDSEGQIEVQWTNNHIYPVLILNSCYIYKVFICLVAITW